MFLPKKTKQEGCVDDIESHNDDNDCDDCGDDNDRRFCAVQHFFLIVLFVPSCRSW